MTFDDKKNSYGSTDLEAGVTGSRIKDAADGPRRFAVIAMGPRAEAPRDVL